MTVFAILAFVWGAVVSVLWLVIGWRAMLAHERIAAAAERSPAVFQRDPAQSPTRTNARSG